MSLSTIRAGDSSASLPSFDTEANPGIGIMRPDILCILGDGLNSLLDMGAFSGFIEASIEVDPNSAIANTAQEVAAEVFQRCEKSLAIHEAAVKAVHEFLIKPQHRSIDDFLEAASDVEAIVLHAQNELDFEEIQRRFDQLILVNPQENPKKVRTAVMQELGHFLMQELVKEIKVVLQQEVSPNIDSLDLINEWISKIAAITGKDPVRLQKDIQSELSDSDQLKAAKVICHRLSNPAEVEAEEARLTSWSRGIKDRAQRELAKPQPALAAYLAQPIVCDDGAILQGIQGIPAAATLEEILVLVSQKCDLLDGSSQSAKIKEAVNLRIQQVNRSLKKHKTDLVHAEGKIQSTLTAFRKALAQKRELVAFCTAVV